MITGAKPMACGNCGHGLFRMYYQEGKRDQSLMAECAKCASVSVIAPTAPSLSIEWGPAAEGILCPMQPTN